VEHQRLVGHLRETLERTTWRLFIEAELDDFHRE
jgi:hypothetical protein